MTQPTLYGRTLARVRRIAEAEQLWELAAAQSSLDGHGANGKSQCGAVGDASEPTLEQPQPAPLPAQVTADGQGANVPGGVGGFVWSL